MPRIPGRRLQQDRGAWCGYISFDSSATQPNRKKTAVDEKLLYQPQQIRTPADLNRWNAEYWKGRIE
jgi:hypothetical protein